jgi:hypothetical protein
MFDIAEAVLFLASVASDHLKGQDIIFGTPASFWIQTKLSERK